MVRLSPMETPREAAGIHNPSIGSLAAIGTGVGVGVGPGACVGVGVEVEVGGGVLVAVEDGRLVAVGDGAGAELSVPPPQARAVNTRAGRVNSNSNRISLVSCCDFATPTNRT
jgi:hypothetical protein